MQRTGRSTLFIHLCRAFHAARRENYRRVGAQPPRVTRRRFLTGTAAGLIASYAAPAHAGNRKPRIAVVGAGIAGLSTTYVLANAGVRALLYEGSDQIGGRIQTNHGALAPNVYTELGGEFIDSGHEDMLSLAQMFGFGLIDTQTPSEAGLEVAYFARGRLWSESEVVEAFQPLAAIVDRDLARLSDAISHDSHSQFDAHLDQTTLRQYFRRNLDVDWLHDVLEAAYVNEYGLNLEDQSSLNFVQTIGTDTSNGFEVYGESDQRYKIRGGNHQIVAALADSVADRIKLGHRLEAIHRRSNGEYVLTFETSHGGDRCVLADFVVLCIPFTILRDIDLRVPLPQVKRNAIKELGYGVNAKLILGFNSPVWRGAGFDGDSYADQAYQSGWDSGREQGSPSGAYTIFPGGSLALALKSGSAHHQAERLLPGLDRVFPGVGHQWLGTALRAYWPSNPYIRASYAAYRPGQWTSIRGAEGTTVKNLYFAGEHTSLDWQGYMNGGAESGRLAAEALINRLAS